MGEAGPERGQGGGHWQWAVLGFYRPTFVANLATGDNDSAVSPHSGRALASLR